MIKGQQWKSNEIELIRKLYPSYKKEKLSMLLPNRTWDAISRKAIRLGIKVDRRELVKTKPYHLKNLKIGRLAERIAKNILERNGFKVYRFNDIADEWFNPRIGTKKLKRARRFCNETKQGRFKPDFFAFKRNEVFVVEVKAGQSRLYPSQRNILLKAFEYGLTPLVVKVETSICTLKKESVHQSLLSSG